MLIRQDQEFGMRDDLSLSTDRSSGDYRTVSSRSRPRTAAPTRRIRLFYFGLASLWGFVTGVGSLASVHALSGAPVVLTLESLGLVLPGALLALVGGAVAAAAYREVRRR
jgi:hypothetical protein